MSKNELNEIVLALLIVILMFALIPYFVSSNASKQRVFKTRTELIEHMNKYGIVEGQQYKVLEWKK